MEQKDFILREIEKIGSLIRYLIGKLITAESILEQQNTEELINNELEEKIGKDLENIINISKNEFKTIFTKDNGFNYENIELLADLLFTIGNNEYSKNSNYLNKALELYIYIDQKSKTYSIERINKINKIKILI